MAVKQGQNWRYIENPTDDSGRVILAGLQPGPLDLSVSAEGYEQTMLVDGLTKAQGPLRVVLPIMRA